MAKKDIKKFNESLFITKKFNYKFNKNIFQTWLGLCFIILGIVLLNYGDYEEYNLHCNSETCQYNFTHYENMTLIDSYIRADHPNISLGSLSNFDYMLSSETLTFASYEKPFLLKYFTRILLILLIIAFIINHIWFKLRGYKNETN